MSNQWVTFLFLGVSILWHRKSLSGVIERIHGTLLNYVQLPRLGLEDINCLGERANLRDESHRANRRLAGPIDFTFFIMWLFEELNLPFLFVLIQSRRLIETFSNHFLRGLEIIWRQHNWLLFFMRHKHSDLWWFPLCWLDRCPFLFRLYRDVQSLNPPEGNGSWFGSYWGKGADLLQLHLLEHAPNVFKDVMDFLLLFWLSLLNLLRNIRF